LLGAEEKVGDCVWESGHFAFFDFGEK